MSYGDVSFVALEEGQEGVFKQCTRSAPWVHFEYWVPSEDQILKVEGKLKSYVNSRIKRKDGIYFSDYYRQYVGFTSFFGQRIYINAAYKGLYDSLLVAVTRAEAGNKEKSEDEKAAVFASWITKPIVICDGFDAAWGAVYDISSDEIVGFDYNNQ